ncbi:MAG: hypothetical protein V1934_01545 [Methanobacteriota archaeon]
MSKKKPNRGAKRKAKAEVVQRTAVEPSATPKPKAAMRLACSNCGKTVKDQRTLKIHQSNCKAVRQKGEAERTKPDPMLAALIDLKDAMASERTEMLKLVAERDAIFKEQMSAKAPAAVEDEKPAPPRVEPAMAAPQRQSSPHGMDMGSYYERPEPWMEQAGARQYYRQYPPPPSPEPPPLSQEDIRALVKGEVQAAVEGIAGSAGKNLSEDEVAAIARKVTEAALAGVPESGASTEEVGSLAKSLDAKLAAVERRISEMDQRMTQLAVERLDPSKFLRFGKDIERLDWKVEALMDEVGFGDSLDVSKIPSNILEIVYQATLEDVVRELGKTRSAQEVGTIIEDTLEEVRKNTSGSELFRYNGRRILTENLARSIDHGLISAKQIQTTYAELLNTLLASVPAYKPKNFRAMIKIKSQEYAVDRVTHLLGRAENSDKIIDNMGQMIAAFSAQSNARFNQFSARLDEVAGPMLERKVDASQFEEARLAINEVRLSVAELARESSRLLAKLELGSVEVQHDAPAEPRAEADGAGPSPAIEVTEGEKLVMSMLADGDLSVSALRKRAESFLSPEDVKAALEGLHTKGLVESKKWKKGKRLSLVSPAQEREGDGPSGVQEPASSEGAPDEVVYAPEADQGRTSEPAEAGAEGPDPSGPESRGQEPVAAPEAAEADAANEGAAGAGLSEQPEETGPEEEKPEPPAKPVELTQVQKRVLEAIGEGATMPSLRSALDDLKYTEILVSVRVLIDCGLVTAESHGRGTTYMRVKGANREEVKNDA